MSLQDIRACASSTAAAYALPGLHLLPGLYEQMRIGRGLCNFLPLLFLLTGLGGCAESQNNTARLQNGKDMRELDRLRQKNGVALDEFERQFQREQREQLARV